MDAKAKAAQDIMDKRKWVGAGVYIFSTIQYNTTQLVDIGAAEKLLQFDENTEDFGNEEGEIDENVRMVLSRIVSILNREDYIPLFRLIYYLIITYQLTNQ